MEATGTDDEVLRLRQGRARRPARRDHRPEGQALLPARVRLCGVRQAARAGETARARRRDLLRRLPRQGLQGLWCVSFFTPQLSLNND